MVQANNTLNAVLGAAVAIHALPTPEAIALFNRLKSEGRRVALLAHSTC